MYSVHPMERLRFVARSGDIDAAVVVAETADALTRLGPAPSELVALCRNLVERNPTCGPLWWLCAHLLANPDSLGSTWQPPRRSSAMPRRPDSPRTCPTAPR